MLGSTPTSRFFQILPEGFGTQNEWPGFKFEVPAISLGHPAFERIKRNERGLESCFGLFGSAQQNRFRTQCIQVQ